MPGAVLPALLCAALGGYVVPWNLDAGIERVERSGGAVADVFLFAARLDGEGMPVLAPIDGSWSEIADRARGAGAKVWLTVVNDRVPAAGAAVLKDAEIVRAVLADPDRRRAHRAAIVALARKTGVSGVDLDYESLPASERDRFTAFVRELRDDLRGAGLALAVTVQPKSGDVSSRGPGAMDWPALCRIADRVQPMLYNEHNASTGPGPIAGLGFVDRVMRYGVSVCAPGRLVPVVKVSGMDWGPSGAVWVAFDDVAARLDGSGAKVRRERTSKVPWFTYRKGDAAHVVYFEDARSVEVKASRLGRLGAPGVVLWSLGSDDPAVIPRLRGGQKR